LLTSGYNPPIRVEIAKAKILAAIRNVEKSGLSGCQP